MVPYLVSFHASDDTCHRHTWIPNVIIVDLDHKFGGRKFDAEQRAVVFNRTDENSLKRHAESLDGFLKLLPFPQKNVQLIVGTFFVHSVGTTTTKGWTMCSRQMQQGSSHSSESATGTSYSYSGTATTVGGGRTRK